MRQLRIIRALLVAGLGVAGLGVAGLVVTGLAVTGLRATGARAGAAAFQTLPETLRGTVWVPVQDMAQGTAQGMAQGMAKDGAEARVRPIDTLRDLFPALARCWQAPEGLAKFERTEITARFSLRRDGSVIGSPRITFSAAPGDGRAKALLVEAALSAIRRCTPAAITPGLGGAVAGRPLALRFIYEGPKGQGI